MINIIDNKTDYQHLLSTLNKLNIIYFKISSGTDECNYMYFPEIATLYVFNDFYHRLVLVELKKLKLTIYLYDTLDNIVTNSEVIDTNALFYSIFKTELNESNLNKDNILLKILDDKIHSFIRSRNNKHAILPLTIISEYYFELFKSLDSFITEYKYAQNNPEYISYIIRKNAFKLMIESGIHTNRNLLDAINESDSVLDTSTKKTVDILNSSEDAIIYPTFNFARTPTGRVISSYKHLNMMALNKSDDTRLFFNSRFPDGYLVEYDYDGMHLRIIANILNFDIPLDIPAHKYMASIFFEKPIDRVTPEDAKESKKKIWSILYGNSYFDHKFMNKIARFKEYRVFKTRTPLNRKIDLSIDEDKRFNYFITKYEVDYITLALKNVSKHIINNRLKMRPILYQYDAILFDIPPDEISKLPEITKILEESIEGITLKVRMKAGKNYKRMTKI